MLSGLPFMLGYFLIVVPSAMKQQDEQHIVYQLCIGRVLSGVGLGMVSISVPVSCYRLLVWVWVYTCILVVFQVYVAEISTAKYRGFLGSCTQVAVTVGLTFSYILGVCLKPYFWLANVALIMVALMVVLMLFVPETPRWLFMNKQKQRAFNTLLWLRGSKADVIRELEEMEERLDNQKLGFHWSMFKQPAVWKPSVIAITILFFQQASGVNSVVFFASIVINSTHPSHELVTYEASILSFAGMVMTILAAVLMDRLGRRVLLLSSSALIILSLIGLGVFFKINDQLDVYNTPTHYSPHASWLAFTCLLIFMGGFGLGWGPIPFLVMSEIVPTCARGTVGGIGAALNWTTSFLVTYLFHDLNKAFSYYGTFWLYAGFGLASLIFVAVLLPETKGRTLEKIEQQWGPPSGQVEESHDHL